MDDTSVYWTSELSPGSVTKAPIGGGPATTLVPTVSAYAVAVAAGRVLFLGAVTGRAMLWSVPVTGGTPSVLFGTPVDDAGVVVASAGGSVSALAVDANNSYFATNNGVIGQIPIVGGSVATLATGQGDANHVFARRRQHLRLLGTGGSLYRTPIGAGPVTRLARIQGTIQGVAADDTNVYFTSVAGGVYRLQK